MQDLRATALIFEQCISMGPISREALLQSIEDQSLIDRLRALLSADARAERDGFLSHLHH